MARTFHCTIVTPDQALFDGEVVYASVPAWDGQLGVMVGASPLLARLGSGPLRLDQQDGTTQWVFIDGGFAQVQDDLLVLLTDRAALAESLSLDEAKAELAEANARVAGPGQNYEQVCADQQRALAKIAVINAATR